MNPVRRRPSPATVISLIALFVALGGTSYAAVTLPRNSVGSRQLKRNSVTSTKVKDGSLLRRDFKNGQLPAGPQGPKGDRGDQGPKGDPGPATGPAGGDLTGNYPNPTIARGAVTSSKLAPLEPPHDLTTSELNPAVWGSGGSGYEPLGYQRDAYGFVHLKGRLRNVTGTSVAGFVFTLPPGYRPAMNRTYAVIINANTAGRIDVFDDGGVWLQGAIPVSGTTSLDGIEFRCAPSGANGCP